MAKKSKARRSGLAAWLSQVDAGQLHRVLAARPDAAAAPVPRTLGELADRLQRPGSVVPAILRLPLPAIQAAEALTALGESASRDDLVDLFGVTGPEAERGLTEALAVLADHALVWPGAHGSLQQASVLGEFWQTPLGLDPSLDWLLGRRTSEEIRAVLVALGIKPPATKAQREAALLDHYGSPDRILAVVAQAPAATRELLERRAHSRQRPGIRLHSESPDRTGAEQWAVERGLLIGDRYGYEPSRMPSEVALSLRGPDWRAAFDPHPPVASMVQVSAADLDRETASAAGAFAVQAAAVLAECAARPPAQLKSGGVGVRELTRIGKAVQSDEPTVRLVLACAREAGLLGRASDGTPATEAYDTWAEQEPAEQVAQLIAAWWRLPYTPTQSRDDEGKPLPALGGSGFCEGCVQARQGLLAALGDLPSGQGVAQTVDLGRLVGWQRPMADHLPQDGTPFAGLIQEATLLGVLARGMLSPLGAALASGDVDELAAQARRLVPAASGDAIIGSDLTAVVTGAPSARLAGFLDAVADREARGTASVWRFGPGSLRRALDAGHDAGAIESELAAISTGPLPQTLTYLIADTARRHGRIRVASVSCVIHGVEEALVAEIAAHRGLAKLGVRKIAPTVLTSTATVTETLAALRAHGYAPVAESADGTVRIERPARQRAKAIPAPRTARGRAQPATPAELRALAERLLSPSAAEPAQPPTLFDNDIEEVLAGWAKNLSPTDIRRLAHAIIADEPVTIEYVAGSGAHTVRTVSNLELDPPMLYAWCHLRSDERVFTLSRLQGIMPA